MARWTLVIACLVSLCACRQRARLNDVGEACLGQDTTPTWRDSGEGAVSIQPGEAVPVVAILAECVSGSVDYRQLDCSTTVSGGVVEVSSFARTIAPRFTRTSDCNWIAVACGEVTLDEGDWSLVYGDRVRDFVVPFEGDSLCVPGR